MFSKENINNPFNFITLTLLLGIAFSLAIFIITSLTGLNTASSNVGMLIASFYAGQNFAIKRQEKPSKKLKIQTAVVIYILQIAIAYFTVIYKSEHKVLTTEIFLVVNIIFCAGAYFILDFGAKTYLKLKAFRDLEDKTKKKQIN